MARIQKSILPSLFTLAPQFQGVVDALYARRRYGFCDAFAEDGSTIDGSTIYNIITEVVDQLTKIHQQYTREDRPITTQYLVDLINKQAEKLGTTIDAADLICMHFSWMGVYPDFDSANYEFQVLAGQ